MSGVVRVTAFIDWDTARRVLRPDPRRARPPSAADGIDAVRILIADGLSSWQNRTAFRVGMRIYHGWHRGKTKTPDRRDLDTCTAHASTIDRVSFSPEFAFGNELLCGGRRSLLFDTLRRRSDGADEQKMVDTALVSDLLQFARNNRSDVALVIGDDDDLLPGVFTAEAWGATVRVLRLRRDDNQHLETTPLILRSDSQ